MHASIIDPNSVDSAWKTFRDDNPSEYVSLHTDSSAIPFEKHWIDMDGKDLRVNRNYVH